MEVYGRVYGLYDPRTDELRYVGQTTVSLERRLSGHIGSQNLALSRHSSRWIKGLQKLGLRPVIRELAVAFTSEELGRLEQEHIRRARECGSKLTNHTDGGTGPKGWKHTKAWKRYMSDKMKGRCTNTDEHMSRLAEQKRGIPRSSEVKKKISDARRGQPSPNRGLRMSEAQKKKISESRKGKLVGPAHHRYRSDPPASLVLEVLSDHTVTETSRLLGVSTTFIYRLLKQEGLRPPPRGKQISVDLVQELCSQGLTLRLIADKLSVSPAYVHKLLKKAG